ncbi:MAG: spore germination protein [Bacillota bacterium]
MEPKQPDENNILDLSPFRNSSDVTIVEKNVAVSDSFIEVVYVYSPNIVDQNTLHQLIIPEVQRVLEKEGALIRHPFSEFINVSEPSEEQDLLRQCEQRIFSGDVLITTHSDGKLLFFSASKIPKRSPEESNTELSIRGPRDGLVESIGDNMALIRQRLKTTSLKSMKFSIGRRSQTDILLLYIADVMNPDILQEVKNRLESIDTDVIVGSYELEEYLYDNKFSLIPQVQYVGRPDYVAESLNQGRFAVLMDGNPTCLIAPANLGLMLSSPEDAHNSFYYVSIERILRAIAFATTIFLPGFWVALTTHQIEQIPYPLLATITVSRTGLPLSTVMELTLMLILFELFKEAGVRLPKAVGQTVAVLGGLIVGDAAIRGGFTSPTMLVIAAITIISGYTLMNQSLTGNVLLLRFTNLFVSGLLGLYGFFLCGFVYLIALASTESFGQPFMASFAKPNLGDFMKAYIKLPTTLVSKRNKAYNPTDPDRRES